MTKPIDLKIVFAIVAILAAIFAFALPKAMAADGPSNVFHIGIAETDVSAGPLYAKASGSFERAGIAPIVDHYPKTFDPLAKVMDGTLDVGFADIISAIHAIQGGEPLVLLAPTAIYDSKHPITVLIAPKARPLHTGADMNGKKLSVPSPTGLGAVAVLNWIDKHGGDSKTISFVTGLPFGDIVAALNDGRVDAAEMSEPIKTEIAPQTSVVASTFDDIAPTFVVGVFVAQKAWVRDNPALARSFTSAMSQAALWANSHHADTAKILAEHYQISPAVLTTMVRATFPEHLTADLIQPVVDVAARYGICLPVDATTLLTK